MQCQKKTCKIFKKISNFLNKKGIDFEFSSEPKIDGLSVNLIYKNGKLVTAATKRRWSNWGKYYRQCNYNQGYTKNLKNKTITSFY